MLQSVVRYVTVWMPHDESVDLCQGQLAAAVLNPRQYYSGMSLKLMSSLHNGNQHMAELPVGPD